VIDGDGACVSSSRRRRGGGGGGFSSRSSSSSSGSSRSSTAVPYLAGHQTSHIPSPLLWDEIDTPPDDDAIMP